MVPLSIEVRVDIPAQSTEYGVERMPTRTLALPAL